MAAAIDDLAVSAPFDTDPFAVLHARFHGPLRRFFASYRLTPADVDDLTQEVFMRLAGPGLPTDLRRPDAFVFTLARNLVRDRARRSHTRCSATSIPFDDVDLACGLPTPEEALEQQERLQHVARAIDSLSPRTRQAFLLQRVHGCSYAEIAAEMNVSVSMIEKHVMAAIAALRGLDG